MTTHIEFRQFQSGLPQYLDQVEAGDTFVVCKDQKPIAVIRPINHRRPVGLAKGKVTFHLTFDEPLPEEILAGFEGKPE